MAPDEPTRKKVRQAPEAPSKSGRSRGEGSTAGLFQPFRALGQITTQAPFSLVARGNALFVTTCLEYNFQVYDVSRGDRIGGGGRGGGENRGSPSFSQQQLLFWSLLIFLFHFRSRH